MREENNKLQFVIFCGYGPEPFFECGNGNEPEWFNPDNAIKFASMGEALDWYIEHYDGIWMENPVDDWIKTLSEAHRIVRRFNHKRISAHKLHPILTLEYRISNRHTQAFNEECRQGLVKLISEASKIQL